ncbi:MAG: GNAT family N-acetyltransferase [Polaromonas sp.]|uniref:GNAT family N-acetyltransferase n=1 Tax=Polaromonas sp. TaxID=1869339 RepID=UPI0024886C2C|nr:GNAT family N-acetyltransferase [Polaromonas sp.]MDI1270367.1 GNAT family N-acetyltransferase [Polaromonas sp.]
MMTQAPLPAWSKLFGAMMRRPLPDAALAAPWHRDGESAGWLSRSAWSLALIALWRKSRTSSTQPTAWLPDFFCNSSLHALRLTGFKLVFYPLTPQMEPDMVACRKLAGINPPDMFLLVHYFGRPVHPAPASDFCRHYGAWLIEDAAHVLRPLDGVGSGGDFVIYSPHKHLSVPDGAVLVVRPNGPGVLGQAIVTSFGPPLTWAGQLRDLQQQMGPAVKSSQVHAWFWLTKRVLQKLGFRGLRGMTTPFAESPDSSEAAAQAVVAPSPSGLGRRLLGGLIGDLGRVARHRQRHQLLWDALLVDDNASVGDLPMLAERSESRAWTPYLGAYQADSIRRAEAMYDRWQGQGLPVTTWPDLPPEVMLDREQHANAWHLRHTRVYLPVHQSLVVREMVRHRGPSGPPPGGQSQLRLVWGDASPGQWSEWMVQSGRSSLLQSWAYGEAKLADSGWRVKRGVFYRGGEIIAFVQLLQKSVAGILRVSRINRGPLFLKPPGLAEVTAVWTELASLGNVFRGKVLAAAPELDLSGPHLDLMAGLGFRQFSPVAWESVWIDLRMELSELRKKLDGKWRTALISAEKHGLRLESGSDDYLFEWMMERYRELMLEKGFTGAPVALLLALRAHLPAESQLLILRAMHGEEAVGGICLVRHGAAATYLLGWNGPAGRRLKANQYLLWNATVSLKQLGLEWFDLGGINEDDTPGIAAFKLGLKGKPYESVGEYWKL